MAAQIDFKTIKVTPINEGFGAIVLGVDWENMSPEQERELHEARDEYSVIVCRGSHVNQKALGDFAERMGEIIKIQPQLSGGHNAHPDDERFFRVTTNYRRPGNDLELHTDLYFKDEPATWSILHAVELDEKSRVDTLFYNMCGVLGSLPEDLVERLKGRDIAVHRAYNPDGSPSPELQLHKNLLPFIQRPLLQKDDRKRDLLYLASDVKPRWIPGMPGHEGDKTINECFKHVREQTQHQYAHRWEPDDVVIWGNQHLHSRGHLDDGMVRTLDRVTVLRRPMTAEH